MDEFIVFAVYIVIYFQRAYLVCSKQGKLFKMQCKKDDKNNTHKR